jgi:hypothetical protein
MSRMSLLEKCGFRENCAEDFIVGNAYEEIGLGSEVRNY